MTEIDLEEAQEAAGLGDALPTVDASLGFLLLIIASVLLSYYSVNIQRRQLVLAGEGDEEGLRRLPDVFPIKSVAGATVVGALGFFLRLAQRTDEKAARQGDAAQRRSARMNLWASVLVLAAAVIRLYDLCYARHSRTNGGTGQPLLGGELLPD